MNDGPARPPDGNGEAASGLEHLAAINKRPRRPKLKPALREADAILTELNTDNSVVMIGAHCRVIRFEDTPHIAGGEHYVHRLPSYVRFDDFRNFYLNRLTVNDAGEPFAVDAKGNVLSIGRWWLEHPKRSQYDGVTFFPGGPPVVEDRLNLWTGFGVEPRRGEWGG
jgi:hypothetical protein